VFSQPQNFENVTLVARRRDHFRIFLAIVLVAQLRPSRGEVKIAFIIARKEVM